jgi:hypothetical protein
MPTQAPHPSALNKSTDALLIFSYQGLTDLFSVYVLYDVLKTQPITAE